MREDSWRVLRWLSALLYLLLCFLPVIFTPRWLAPWLIGAILLIVACNFGTWEGNLSRTLELRPLTRWDLKEYDQFRRRLDQAWREMGLSRQPLLAVVDSKFANAMAVGGRRGMVIFTTRLLRTCTTDQILAIVGHELKHLAARDGLPAMVGGVALRTFGRLIALMAMMPVLNLLAVPLSWAFRLIAFVAQAVMAKRSRMEEHLADMAGARLTSAVVMIDALSRVEAEHRYQWGDWEPPAWSPLWVVQRLHASHPPHEARVRFLEEAAGRGELDAV